MSLTDGGTRVFVTLLVVVWGSIGLAFWRYRAAREVAEEWLLRHRFRVRSLRVPLFRMSPFSASLTAGRRRATHFRAEVDDLSLGGAGVVWLRVWSDWLGSPDREPEVSWERMPQVTDDRSRTIEDRWHRQQLSLLERVAAGEHTFRGRSRSADDGEAFDDEVEHLLAMSRRGFVTCNTPIMDIRGPGQYAAISNVELTDAGRRFLDAQRQR